MRLANIELYFAILFAFLAIVALNLWRMWSRDGQKRFIVANELISGETTSLRAKRVMFPVFCIFLLDFVSSTVRWQLTGFSGFSGATPEGAGYAIVEHSHTFHISSGQFWLGRIQAVIFLLSFVVWFAARRYFLHTGDIRRERLAA